MYLFPVDRLKTSCIMDAVFIMVDPCKIFVFKNCHKFIASLLPSRVGFKFCFTKHQSVLFHNFANGLMNWLRATYNANWDQWL